MSSSNRYSRRRYSSRSRSRSASRSRAPVIPQAAASAASPGSRQNRRASVCFRCRRRRRPEEPLSPLAGVSKSTTLSSPTNRERLGVRPGGQVLTRIGCTTKPRQRPL
uniref:Uncharacterized protein n=1 Tax=Macrostomum lignano TaxID=282301 RepID=A0A1I8FGM0_9PLAT